MFDEDSYLNEEIHPVNNTNTAASLVLYHPVPTPRTSRRHGTTMYQPARVLEAVYPPAMGPPVTTNIQQDQSPSIMTFETTINYTHFAQVGWDFEGNGSSTHQAEYIQQSPQT